jgi:hypothetical protein
VSLDWADSPDLRGGDSYQVYVDDKVVDLAVGSSSYTVTGLANGTTYRFRVSAGQRGSYGAWTTPVLGTPKLTVVPDRPKPPVPDGDGGGGGDKDTDRGGSRGTGGRDTGSSGGSGGQGGGGGGSGRSP